MAALRVNLDAQQPLGHVQALARAQELRERGGVWTWNVIAEVMAEYHGFTRAPGWWKNNLRGRVAAKPRGVPFGECRVFSSRDWEPAR